MAVYGSTIHHIVLALDCWFKGQIQST